MKIAIIGRTQMLYDTAIAFADAGHEISSIITATAAPEYTRKEDDFRNLAEEYNCAYFLSKSLDAQGIEDACRGLDMGISVNWVSVVQQKHIDWFNLGILNAHLGDLPRYRGNACPNWAIMQGEKEIVLSIHFMEGGLLDCGRIVLQDRILLNEDTTIKDIYLWSEENLPKSFVKSVEILKRDPSYTLKYADPDSTDAFRCYPRLPEDGYINWDMTAEYIHRVVRASGPPFDGAYTFHVSGGILKKMYVYSSKIIEKNTKDLAVPGHVLKNNKNTGESWVKCREGIIGLQECRYADEMVKFNPGKRWKSIKMRLGVRVEDSLVHFRANPEFELGTKIKEFNGQATCRNNEISK